MVDVANICETYGFSRSTALRHLRQCFDGDAPKRGNKIELDASQAGQFADYLEKQGVTMARQDKPQRVTAHQTAPNDAPDAPQQAEQNPLENPLVIALIDSYKDQINRLEAENMRLHEALEREQMQARGFWSRLGQRLLGPGKSRKESDE